VSELGAHTSYGAEAKTTQIGQISGGRAPLLMNPPSAVQNANLPRTNLNKCNLFEQDYSFYILVRKLSICLAKKKTFVKSFFVAPLF